MALMDEIENEIAKQNIPKWKILEINAGDEIRKMIAGGIAVTRQVELLLKYGVVEKLDRKEYTGIITKHFGYVPQKREDRKKSNTKNKNRSVKKETVTIPVVESRKPDSKKPIKKRSAVDRLSEDVDLMGVGDYLNKKAEEMRA